MHIALTSKGLTSENITDLRKMMHQELDISKKDMDRLALTGFKSLNILGDIQAMGSDGSLGPAGPEEAAIQSAKALQEKPVKDEEVENMKDETRIEEIKAKAFKLMFPYMDAFMHDEMSQEMRYISHMQMISVCLRN
jgi:hypothetical protein